jgi:hypothetical protein
MKTEKKMTRTRAEEIAGSLSDPSKMPAYAYGLPTAKCITGSKLAKIPGTACSICYAEKGNYIRYRKNVQAAQYKRLKGIEHPLWVDAMVVRIAASSKRTPYFRWHDSGDLQSVEHLRKIVSIAVLLPEVHFWLPTREYGIVQEYLASGGQVPKNLVIRLSAHKIGGPVPDIAGLPVSTIFADGTRPPAGAVECQAQYHDGKCMKCRACWDPAVQHVSYYEH